MRIGVLGGTFDPIHLGHLIIAEEARVRLDLEKLMFMPAGEPWMKAGTLISPVEHRVNMVRLAIASNPFFRVSSIEIDRPGPSYTVDTLRSVIEEMGAEVEIFFVLGMDSVEELHQWKEPATVLELATLVAVNRPGHEGDQSSSLEEHIPGASQRMIVLEGPSIDISSKNLRERMAQGLSIRYQVPDAVACYVVENHLYRDGRGEA